MIVLGNTLISLDIFETEFVCNLNQCKGSCCVEGDYGAPLDAEEVDAISGNLEGIKPYMTERARKKLDKQGFHEADPDGDLVTQCIGGRDCIFAIEEAGMYKCAIEKAHYDGKSSFLKPISCHLYPIRLSQVGEFTALNYHKWDICSDACHLGAALKVPVYKFLKNALIRQFGESWYHELEHIAAEYEASRPL